MMSKAAIYARVSSEQQAKARTIESQIEALLERAKEDEFEVPAHFRFIDDGHSGATLVRPALENLRDSIYSGGFERLYVHSPDRLSRKYVYQILLTDEFKKAGVEVCYLNHRSGDSPEDHLLLQIQGMIAEYERAKTAERSRRGRLHAARLGAVSVMAAAPFGYTYVPKKSSPDGQAKYVVIPYEAEAVKKIFEWFTLDRLAISEIRRRLEIDGVKTRKGQARWCNKTIWGMLKNPAYMGEAGFGRSKVGPRRSEFRKPLETDSYKKMERSLYVMPTADWIGVPVPQLVSRSLFDAAQVRLGDNRREAKARKDSAKYLLQGIVSCSLCKYAIHGTPVWYSKNDLFYLYYRCPGKDPNQCRGKRICDNPGIRADLIEPAVIEAVLGVLENPDRLLQRANGRPKDADPATQKAQERRKAFRRFSGLIAEVAPQVRADLCQEDRLVQKEALRLLVQQIDIDYFKVTISFRADGVQARIKDPTKGQSEKLLQNCPYLTPIWYESRNR